MNIYNNKHILSEGAFSSVFCNRFVELQYPHISKILRTAAFVVPFLFDSIPLFYRVSMVTLDCTCKLDTYLSKSFLRNTRYGCSFYGRRCASLSMCVYSCCRAVGGAVVPVKLWPATLTICSLRSSHASCLHLTCPRDWPLDASTTSVPHF